MKLAGPFALTVAFLLPLFPLTATAGAGAEGGTSMEVEKPAVAPAEPEGGYRPRWADPNAKPPEPGIENDPTPFNPADVDANTDTLNNNISPINPD
jgi:hypothetical protein